MHACLSLRMVARLVKDDTVHTLFMAFDCLYVRGKDLRERLAGAWNVLEELVDG